jgi:hypothetical protein
MNAGLDPTTKMVLPMRMRHHNTEWVITHMVPVTNQQRQRLVIQPLKVELSHLKDPKFLLKNTTGFCQLGLFLHTVYVSISMLLYLPGSVFRSKNHIPPTPLKEDIFPLPQYANIYSSDTRFDLFFPVLFLFHPINFNFSFPLSSFFLQISSFFLFPYFYFPPRSHRPVYPSPPGGEDFSVYTCTLIEFS